MIESTSDTAPRLIPALSAFCEHVLAHVPDVTKGGCTAYTNVVAQQLGTYGISAWGMLDNCGGVATSGKDDPLADVPSRLNRRAVEILSSFHLMLQFEHMGRVWTHDFVTMTDAELGLDSPSPGSPPKYKRITKEQIASLDRCTSHWLMPFDHARDSYLLKLLAETRLGEWVVAPEGARPLRPDELDKYRKPHRVINLSEGHLGRHFRP